MNAYLMTHEHLTVIMIQTLKHNMKQTYILVAQSPWKQFMNYNIQIAEYV